MLAVEASTHALARELAALLDMPIYAAVAVAIRTALAVKRAEAGDQ